MNRHLAGLMLVALAGALPDSVRAAATDVAPVKSVKRPSVVSAGDDFVAVARAQIARLRQTADQLRVLAMQPLPATMTVEDRAEFARHEQWLRQAETRIETLARQWENRVSAIDDTRSGTPRLADLNAFFQAQLLQLQTRLDSESASESFTRDAAKYSNETVKAVINNMN